MPAMVVRAVRSEDAETLAELSASLGYAIDAAAIRSAVEHLASEPERLVLAAVVGDDVVGWVDAAVERHLQSETVVVMSGIVVRDDLRGGRIGRALCRAVETRALDIGVASVRVRSQQNRSDPHRFYLRDGYERKKVSVVFEKRLAP